MSPGVGLSKGTEGLAHDRGLEPPVALHGAQNDTASVPVLTTGVPDQPRGVATAPAAATERAEAIVAEFTPRLGSRGRRRRCGDDVRHGILAPGAGESAGAGVTVTVTSKNTPRGIPAGTRHPFAYAHQRPRMFSTAKYGTPSAP